MLGRLVQWLRLPGLVRPVDYKDPVTGQRIKVRTSPRYTIISVDDSLELYFNRESGRFDGSGAMSLDDPVGLNRLQAARIQQSAAARGASGALPR